MSATQRCHATGLRRPEAALDVLLAQPQRFGFFQAVRLLEMCWPGASEPTGVVGDRVRFRNSLSLSFPASEIESLTVSRMDEGGTDAACARPLSAVELTPAFMGLLGGQGTLPLVYTEQLAWREVHHKDGAARAFMDVFSNRAVTLFYQAWKKHRLHVQFESDRRQRFLPLAMALSGMGQRGLRERFTPQEHGVNDEALAYYAGTLQQRTLSAHQLRQVLQDYLGVPVRMEQFVGRWYTIPEQGRTLLGLAGPGVLGQSAMLGDRVWQRDLCVRIHLGPLNHEQFRRYLPGAPGAAALKALLTLLSGVSLEWEINLQLRRADVCGSTLDSTRPATQARLGWDTFLLTDEAANDRTDVRYDIHAVA